MPPITRADFIAAMVKCHDRNALVDYEKLWLQHLERERAEVEDLL